MTTSTEPRSLSNTERQTLVESARETAEMEYDSLVASSTVPSEWNSDSDEPWHCLSLSRDGWSDELSDEARDEAYRIYHRAAADRWQELLEKRDAVIAEIVAPHLDEDHEAVMIAVAESDIPGTESGRPDSDATERVAKWDWAPIYARARAREREDDEMAQSRYYYVKLDSDLEHGSSLATVDSYVGRWEDGAEPERESDAVRDGLRRGLELVVLDCRARIAAGTRVVVSEDGRIVRRARKSE